MKETIEMVKYLFSNEGDIEVKTMFKVSFVCMVISLIFLALTISVLIKAV